MHYTHLIQVAELQQLQAQAIPFMIFDCTGDLSQPERARQQYLDAHLPGAYYVDLNRHLSEHGGKPSASGGRHPLPLRENFAHWLGTIGFSNTTQAVVYDRNGCNYCGRLWWMLKWVGHDAVAVLDGGLQAWQAAGGAVAQGEEATMSPSTFVLRPALRKLVDTQAVLACLPSAGTQGTQATSQPILDARAGARYRGEVEPLDPVAGHIPGALNRPFGSNLDEQGRFKSPAQLRAEFAQLLGQASLDTEVIHHCGSGVSALPNVVAMELAGYAPGALYAGSWSEWCQDPKRPVARG